MVCSDGVLMVCSDGVLMVFCWQDEYFLIFSSCTSFRLNIIIVPTLTFYTVTYLLFLIF